jgi:integrase
MTTKSNLKLVPKRTPKSDEVKIRNRLTPIPESIQYIHGYPKKLIIYKTDSSRYYWTRLYFNGRYHTKSTKSESIKDSKKFSIKFYEDVLFKSKTDKISDKTKSFGVVGGRYMKSIEKTITPTVYRTELSRYKNDILPFFGEQEIDTITNSQISKFIERLKERELSTSTIKHFMVVLRKIFKFGVSNDIITQIPVFPKISGRLQTSQKRDYLTQDEYEHLVKTSEKLSKQKISIRGTEITDEMKYLIQFMVNTFIRPSDLRVLKHKHIKKTKDGNDEWLVLNHPGTKTTSTEVQGMPVSVFIYERLVKFKKENNLPCELDDYVFFPQFKENRNTSIEVIGRLFRRIVKESQIKETTGKNITLYSLRHTSIMMRLIIGQVDSLVLSRNARTSQQMIDKFYTHHLTTGQVRKQLHSFPNQDIPSEMKEVKRTRKTK